MYVHFVCFVKKKLVVYLFAIFRVYRDFPYWLFHPNVKTGQKHKLLISWCGDQNEKNTQTLFFTLLQKCDFNQSSFLAEITCMENSCVESLNIGNISKHRYGVWFLSGISMGGACCRGLGGPARALTRASRIFFVV